MLHSSGNQPGGLVLNYSVAVNGVPFLFRIHTGLADSYGDWIQIVSVPTGLSGTVVEFFCFGQTPDGFTSASNGEVLTLE